MSEEQSSNRTPRRLSYSSLKEFQKSPRHLLEYWEGEKKETDEMIFGSFFHTMVLQPEKLEKEYKLWDEERRPDLNTGMTSKVNKEWKFKMLNWAKLEGINWITPENWQRAEDMKKSLMNYDKSAELLTAAENEFEKEITWKCRGEECVAVLDIRNPYFVADIKTARSAYPPEFRYAISKFRYWIQGGMYVDGENESLDLPMDDWKDFYIIAIEKEPPYLVSVHLLSKEAIARGITEYRMLIDSYKIAKDNLERGYDFWSPFGEDGIFIYDLPKWLEI